MGRKAGLKPDARGRYYRNLGYLNNGQPKFILGDDPDEAERRNERLERLWKAVCERWHRLPSASTTNDGEFISAVGFMDGSVVSVRGKGERPTWDDVSLTLAKAIADGHNTCVAPKYADETNEDYVKRLADLSEAYPVITLLPAQSAFDEVRKSANKYKRIAEQQLASSQGLHEALDAFVAWIGKTYRDPANGELTEWGQVKTDMAKRLKDHHADMPLSGLTRNQCRDMLSYWRSRPCRKGQKTPISPTTAKNHLTLLKEFLKWMDQEDAFQWTKTFDLSDFRVRIQRTAAETSRQAQTLQVSAFTLEELKTLWSYVTTDKERALFLLGLNCAFASAESGGLHKTEVHLDKPHRHYKMAGSWIMRVRHKSGVYGEWKLWPETAAIIQKTLKQHPGITVLASKAGKPLIGKTKGGNKGARILNIWRALYRKVWKVEKKFRYLPFKYLRKTSADLIRQVADGELAGLHLCHGQPVKTDALSEIYSNRPFVKLFKAQDEVRQLLISHGVLV